MESDTEMNTFQCYPLHPLFENDLFSGISTNGFEDDLFSEIPPNGFKNIIDNLTIETHPYGFETNNNTSGNLDDLNTETQQYNSRVNTSISLS
ncbi:17520_t:CDS:2 [Gigaspora rosea]|nr:17520_t:CDS:2 [Gigaspora rosea]